MLRNDLPNYGIDAELAKKQAAKYDPVAEQEARDWISYMTGKPFPEGSFQEGLRDGVLLLEVLNSMIPGSAVPNTSKMAFKQMENISTFLGHCVKLGVPKNDLFQTVDLFENQNMNQVILGIHAVSRTCNAQGLCPVIGPKLAEAAPRNFTPEVLAQSNAVFSSQMGFTGGANQSGQNFGNRRHIMKN